MSVDYQLRFTPVIRYIEKHFLQQINLSEMAKLANLSPYHFHRIFCAVTGEKPQAMLRRLRLESAASELFHAKHSVTEIALEHGFSSSQSLAKAFRQHYAVTPTAIRDCQSYAELTTLLQNSKIGDSLRNTGHAAQTAGTYTGCELTQRSDKLMKTQQFEPSTLAYIRVTGPYGEGYEPAAKALYQWAGANGLTDATCLFIYHDNPQLTPAEKCRTDICLMVPEGTQTSPGIELKPFTGGSYAVVREQITEKSQYANVWQSLLDQVVESQLEIDDQERPCFELYHSYDLQTGHADVSICVAIKA